MVRSFEFMITRIGSMWRPHVRRLLQLTCWRAVVVGFLISGPGTAAAAERSIYALLVGINDYADAAESAYAASDLNGTGNDVALMRDLLVGTYQVPNDSDHFKVLLDAEATHGAIAQAFEDQLIRRAKQDPNAVFLFYFSGHGSLAIDDNGDEGDGYDETLVAHDSRAANGSDINDDEIEGWLTNLRQHTDNIVLIFDSCHSGTASKAPGMKARRAPFRTEQAKNAVVLPKEGLSKGAGSINNPERKYSIIAGSRAEEVSNEDLIQTKDGSRYHGLLTYYLVQALQQSPYSTYREAVMEAERLVRERAPSQHPQAEADFDRVMFGGIGTRQTPYISITSVAGDSIEVAAGQAQGLQDSAILAVYANTATKLVGEEGKIGEAIVTKADVKSSTARFVGAGKETVTTASKVRIVSPYSASRKLPVSIAAPPAKLEFGPENPIKAALSDRLRDNALLKLDEGMSTATLIVSIGCLDQETLVPMEESEALSPNCEKVYYVSPRDQMGALHDFRVSVSDDKAAVDSIVTALEKIARQENLRTLSNGASPLARSIKISLVRVEVKEENGKLVPGAESVVSSSAAEPVRLGEHFRFELTNAGEEDVFFSIIGLGSSGSVFVLDGAPGGDKLQAGAKVTTKPALKVGPPLGLESYVLLATTLPVNVRFLEEPGIKAKAAGPLGWLLDGLANPGFKDPEKVPEFDLDSWATARIDIDIQP